MSENDVIKKICKCCGQPFYIPADSKDTGIEVCPLCEKGKCPDCEGGLKYERKI